MTTRWTVEAAEEHLRSIGYCTIQKHDDPRRAFERLKKIWHDGLDRIREAAKSLKAGARIEETETSGCYPFIAVAVPFKPVLSDMAPAYGVCHRPGLYIATATRLDRHEQYWIEQLTLLMKYHPGQILIGISNVEIPLKYVPDIEKLELPTTVQAHFHGVDPVAIGYSNRYSSKRAIFPLKRESALMTDYLLSMGRHHMGTDNRPGDFAILANYPFYLETFAAFAQSEDAKARGYTKFIPAAMAQVGTATISAQFPTYKLEHESGYHLSVHQIGVGASNVLTMSRELAADHILGVILAGHTGSMRADLKSGHYALPESFYRDHAFFDDEVPMDVPIPHIREFSTEFRQAIMDQLGIDKKALRSILHTGTVASTMRRDWEIEPLVRKRLIRSRPVCVEMEAAYMMAAMYHMAIPAGVLLCASDSPLFGDVKEHNASRQMYGTKTMEHLMITIRAVDALRKRIPEIGNGVPSFYSRKLFGLTVPPLR